MNNTKYSNSSRKSWLAGFFTGIKAPKRKTYKKPRIKRNNSENMIFKAPKLNKKPSARTKLKALKNRLNTKYSYNSDPLFNTQTCYGKALHRLDILQRKKDKNNNKKLILKENPVCMYKHNWFTPFKYNAFYHPLDTINNPKPKKFRF